MTLSLRGAVALLASAAALLAVAPAQAATSGRTVDRLERFWATTYKATPKAKAALAYNEAPAALLAKATPDECFADLGAPYVPSADGTCATGRTPKVNQAYVWGLAKSGDDLWFGTAPNVLCLVFSGYLGQTTPTKNGAYACEFGTSGFKQTLAALPGALGDWRPSDLFRYSVKTGGLENLSKDLTGADRQRLDTTLGIRAAGSLGRVVFFAGPSMGMGGGLNVFAFDTQTGKLVSSAALPDYTNIRRFVVADGELYTAVGKKDGTGALLRWEGDPANPAAASLFSFAEAGTLPSEGADLVEHAGRIYVSTWPRVGGGAPQTAGVFQSAPLGTDGVPATSDPMTEIWRAGDYEPDPVVAATYGGGALASFDGKLVWGTMHVPMVATLAAVKTYYGGSPSENEALATVLGTWRAVAIFSATDPGGPAEAIDLLYGNPVLPRYTGGGWSLVPNEMGGATPKLGLAGFDDPFNNYTWAMGVTDRGLYVGTMDHSYLVNKALHPLIAQITGQPIDEASLNLPAGTPGADLLRFTTLARQAVSVSRSGLGNYTNYGVRTMVAEPERLYVGTANPMNLMTSTSDDAPEGGWELRRVGPAQPFEPEVAPQQPPVVTQVTQVVAGPTIVASSDSRQCTPRRRKQFTLRLGLRLKQASRTGMLNVSKVTATVAGRKLKTSRGKTGLNVAVDLTGVKGRYAVVRVVLDLEQPVQVTAKGKTRMTKRLVRTYRYTVCG